MAHHSSLRAKLQTPTAKAGNIELMACLTLVAPGGMSTEDRGAWAAVARQALTGIPADLLAKGCKAAMLRCKFPSEVVPAIMDEVASEWRARRRAVEYADAAERNRNTPLLEAPEYITIDEFREALKGILPGNAA